MIVSFKAYSDVNFCKRCLIRAKQLMLGELEEYNEVIVMPEREEVSDDKR